MSSPSTKLHGQIGRVLRAEGARVNTPRTPEPERAGSRLNILGVEFDNVTRAHALAWMERAIDERLPPRMICTPNADHLLLIRKDVEFRHVLRNADLVVADGMGIVYASRILGRPLSENVGGRLLLPDFARRAATKGYVLFLLGGHDQAQATAAAERLRRDCPGLSVRAWAPPFREQFTEADTQQMLDVIAESRADALFVGLGTPKQECWIAQNLHRLNASVVVGVGAAVDILSGRVSESPAWMTRVGLEWLFKMWQEPRRMWRRYLLGIPHFLVLVLVEAMTRRNARQSLRHHV